MKDLFEPFYNNKGLVTPQVSDDWRIAPSKIMDTINLKSKKTKQKVLVPVVNLVDFLNYQMVEKKLSKDEILVGGDSITVPFIIDKYLNIVPEDEYKVWKKIDEQNKSLQNSNLKIGHVYSLENGLLFVFLGKRYVSEVVRNKYMSFDRITPIKEKNYILLHNEVVELKEYIYDDSDKQVLTEKEAEEKLNEFYETNYRITYFGKHNIENPSYEFVHSNFPSPFLRIGDKYYTKVQNSNNIETCWLFGSKYIKDPMKFEFELDLSGKDFSQGQSIPIMQNKSEDIELVRIGVK